MRFHPEAIHREEFDLKRVLGGLLVQTPDLRSKIRARPKS